MKAKEFFEASPTETPTKPDIEEPTKKPGKEPERPKRHPDPWRRKFPKPGVEPKPKACESRARAVVRKLLEQ